MSGFEVICLSDDDDIHPQQSSNNYVSEATLANIQGQSHNRATRRNSLRQSRSSGLGLGSVIKYAGTEGTFQQNPVPLILSDSDDDTVEVGKVIKPHARIETRISLISDSEEELPDLNSSDDDSPAFSTLSKKLKAKKIIRNPKGRATAKIKLPKFKPSATSTKISASPPPTSTNALRHSDELFDRVALNSSRGSGSDSPSKKSPKKKKTVADIVTDIHETSTDEIDSDEISASQEKIRVDPSPSKIAHSSSNLQNTAEPQPCCSKSLQPQIISRKGITEVRKRIELISSDDDELPDIDFHVNIDPKNKSTLGLNNPVNQRSKSPKYGLLPTSMESYSQSSSSTVGYSSVSNSQASNGQGHTKKQQKELDLERRKQEKEIKRLEKEQKKAEEVREKELKKMENELRRNSKPGEAYKFMIVVLDSEITNKLDGLTPQLVAAEIKYESKMFPVIENSITFKRELVHQAMNDDLQMVKVIKVQEEDQLMVIIDSDKAIPMINSQINKGGTASTGDLDIDLISWVSSIKTSCPSKKLTLFLYDMDKFFKKVKRTVQQEFRNRVLHVDDDQPQKKRKVNNKTLPQISKTELQSALIELQLQTGINYRMVKNVAELGTALIQYTKAIADAPFKKQRQESQGFDWFALSETAGSVKVHKDGAGLRMLWINQLQQFNNVGLDIAGAIASKYPSPRSLIEAYQLCNSEEEGQELVKDISVTTGDGPLARKRKVGPELSKKMYRFFTSTNGDRFLGSTSDSR